MTTTARQALNALIDDLVASPAHALPSPRPQLAAAPAPVLHLPMAVPQQRPVAQAYDVLPTGARNAILWRSRTA